MISLSSGRTGTKTIGLGFDAGGVDDVDENRDDRTLDPDISFSYIDEKIKNVLGHFQKDFEGGVSVDNLGSKFGGYGSFLPAYKWNSPNALSSSKHSLSKKIAPFFEDPYSASQSVLEPSSSWALASGNSLRTRSCEEFKADGGDKMHMNNPSSTQSPDTEIKPNNPAEKNFLKIRIKLGPNDLLPRKNAEIYSGLGLDESPSPSTESPETSNQHSPKHEDSINVSPNRIIQTMTTFTLPEELPLSPLPDYLINLTGKGSVQMGPISKCRSKNHSYIKSNSNSWKYDGILNQGKCENGLEENTDHIEQHIVPFKGDEGIVGKQEASSSLTSSKKLRQMVIVNEDASSRKKRVDFVNDSQTNSRKEGTHKGGNAFEPEEYDSGKQKGIKTSKAKTLDLVKKTVINNIPKPVFDEKNSKKYISLNTEKRKASVGDEHRGYFEGTKLENKCYNTDKVPMNVSKKSTAKSTGSKEAVCGENIDKDSNSDSFSLEAYGKICSPPPNNSKGSDPDPSRSNVSPAIINENWVCCDICQTWRLLPITTYPDSLPEKWTCSMLDWLPGMNNCSFSEEETTMALMASCRVVAPEAQNSNVDGGKKVTQVPNVGDNSPAHMTVNKDKNRRLYGINESSPVIDFASCNEGKAGDILGETYKNKHKPLSGSLSGGEKKLRLKNIKDDDRISEQEKTAKEMDFDLCKNLSSGTAKKRRPKHADDPPPKESKSNTIHGRDAPITKSKRRFLPDLDDQSTQSDDKDHLSEKTGVVAQVSKDEELGVKKAKLSNTKERQTTVKNALGKGDLKLDSIKDQNAISDLGHGSVQKKDQSKKNVGSLLNSGMTSTSSSGKVSGPKKTTYNLNDCVVSPVESISSSTFKVSHPHLPVSIRKKLLVKGEIQKSSDYIGNITENASQNMVSPQPKKVKDLETVARSKGGLVNSMEQKPRLEKNKTGCKGYKTEEMKDNKCNVKSNREEADNSGVKISKKETSTTPQKLPLPISDPLEGRDACLSVVDTQSGKRQKIAVQSAPDDVINCDNNLGRKDPPSQAVNIAFNEARRLKHMADRLKNSWSIIDGIGLYFQAALKFLHVAYLLETCSDNDRNCEVESVQMYRSTAGLFQYCAHEYEKATEMALAALSFKCVEVACMRVVYGSHSVAGRDRHELQMSLQGQSPSSSASDVDNVNNPLTDARLSAPGDGGIISNPQPEGNLTLDGKKSHSLARLLNFVSDVNCGMEASRKSEAAFAAAVSSCSNSGGSTRHKDGMPLVRKVLDFRFNDVDAILQLIRLAMDSFS